MGAALPQVAAGELPLALQALRLLAENEAQAREPGQGVALARLAKALGVQVSVLMREFTQLSDARLGATAGPGWVRVAADEGGRWLAWTTAAGREVARQPLLAAEPGPGITVVQAAPYEADGVVDAPRAECVAEEWPVAMTYNGISHAVMLATPADLEDFALGFSLTEGLIDSAADLLDVEIEEASEGTVLNLRVSARCEMRLKERRRNLAGRTGCGLCGTDTLSQVRRAGLAPVQPWPAEPLALARAMQELAQAQHLQAQTGGVHAAAWCDPAGALRLIREDVGRHNALDKLIGAMQRQQADPGDGFIAVSSRASFEMVQKTAVAGVGLLAAVSAPTGLAVRLAAELGVTLVGFVRQQRGTVYRPAAGAPSSPVPPR